LDVDFDANLARVSKERIEDVVAFLKDLLGDFRVLGLDLDLDVSRALFHFAALYEAEGNDVPGEAWIFDF
jgi:hypothetical protein